MLLANGAFWEVHRDAGNESIVDFKFAVRADITLVNPMGNMPIFHKSDRRSVYERNNE